MKIKIIFNLISFRTLDLIHSLCYIDQSQGHYCPFQVGSPANVSIRPECGTGWEWPLKRYSSPDHWKVHCLLLKTGNSENLFRILFLYLKSTSKYFRITLTFDNGIFFFCEKSWINLSWNNPWLTRTFLFPDRNWLTTWSITISNYQVSFEMVECVWSQVWIMPE